MIGRIFRKPITLLLSTCVLLTTAKAQNSTPNQAQAFQSWVAGLEARQIQVSTGLWDLASGKLLMGHQNEKALIPASTTKVVSTYAMLKSWKSDFQIETEVWGDLRGQSIQGDLVFKGAGDPFLVSERIWLLAQEFKKKGVRRITGSIRLDQSAFDTQSYGRGWENTSQDATPPILPLSINFNRDEKGAISHQPDKNALQIVNGIFKEVGIAVLGGKAQSPSQPRAPRLLTTLKSPPLRQFILDINKFSNNFMVEMLVKRFGEGSWTSGVQRIQTFYQNTLQLGPDQIQITDGSGLSKENRLSARTLATILRAAWHDYEVGPEFISSLKIMGGEPWRMKIQDTRLTRRVRCKTGYLDNVHTVCGYLQTRDGQHRVFAILLNGKAKEDDIWSMVGQWADGEPLR